MKIAAVLFLIALAGRASAGDLAADLDTIATRAFRSGLAPGMSVAAVKGGRIVWQAGYGDADRARGLRANADTRCYIASTTKALTALAAVRLAAHGRLDLDAPLSRALPGVVLHAGLDADSIRVRDLLAHTHGIDPAGPISTRVSFTGEY